MSPDRIVSFVPSITELLFEIGVSEKIFGVTHECTYPQQAKTKPTVIKSVFDSDLLDSKEINDKISKLTTEGKAIFKIDENILRQARPDLIISQEICDVCSAGNNHVLEALSILDKKPSIYTIDPHDLDGILVTIKDISNLVGKQHEGIELVESLRRKMNFYNNLKFKERPRVLCLEWAEPLFSAGHWIPEIVEIAGGKNLISSKSERSKPITLNEISIADPDIIILMPCGFDIPRTVKEYRKYLEKDKIWNELRAVKEKKVFAVDANAYFSKPSFRTFFGIEILGKIFHSEIFKHSKVQENEFRNLIIN